MGADEDDRDEAEQGDGGDGDGHGGRVLPEDGVGVRCVRWQRQEGRQTRLTPLAGARYLGKWAARRQERLTRQMRQMRQAAR
ncbi:hypothetical protein KCMC57_up33780 [Kitasatospora sp. CMC57]